MFTGIIEETGKIESIIKSGGSAKIKIECLKILEGSIIGDSIAVNGVCLTASAIGKNYFHADVSFETLGKSSLKSITAGQEVNLERAATLTSRLGGHLVQGHVDDMATVASVTKKGDFFVLQINYPKQLDKYITDKCSVTLDGISLTVTHVKNCSFQVAVIPHTFENTNLKYKKAGSIINIEIDQIARYIEKLLKCGSEDTKLKSIIEKF